MTRYRGWPAGAVAVLVFMMVNTTPAQLMSTCVPDSPESRVVLGGYTGNARK